MILRDKTREKIYQDYSLGIIDFGELRKRLEELVNVEKAD